MTHGRGRHRDRAPDTGDHRRALGHVAWSGGRGWALKLLLLAVASATVVMHHLAGGLHHDASNHATGHTASVANVLAQDVPGPHPRATDPDPRLGLERTASADSMPHPSQSATRSERALTSPMIGPAPPAASNAVTTPPSNVTSASVHAQHPPAEGDGDTSHSLFHLCLAVLAAAAAAAVALALIRLPADVADHRGGLPRRIPRGDGAPPPPVPLRLAQLQILRL